MKSRKYKIEVFGLIDSTGMEKVIYLSSWKKSCHYAKQILIHFSPVESITVTDGFKFLRFVRNNNGKIVSVCH